MYVHVKHTHSHYPRILARLLVRVLTLGDTDRVIYTQSSGHLCRARGRASQPRYPPRLQTVFAPAPCNQSSDVCVCVCARAHALLVRLEAQAWMCISRSKCNHHLPRNQASSRTARARMGSSVLYGDNRLWCRMNRFQGLIWCRSSANRLWCRAPPCLSKFEAHKTISCLHPFATHVQFSVIHTWTTDPLSSSFIAMTMPTYHIPPVRLGLGLRVWVVHKAKRATHSGD